MIDPLTYIIFSGRGQAKIYTSVRLTSIILRVGMSNIKYKKAIMKLHHCLKFQYLLDPKQLHTAAPGFAFHTKNYVRSTCGQHMIVRIRSITIMLRHVKYQSKLVHVHG